MQRSITIGDSYSPISDYFNEIRAKKIFVVCDRSVSLLKIDPFLKNLENAVFFSDFAPNPVYEDIEKAVKLFDNEQCDSIFAVGGGSAMDTAKCVKLFSGLDSRKCFLEQEIIPARIPFAAMPTTAGSGSEATKYAVIYYKGLKQSVTDESCIPQTIVYDPSVLETLPAYQKKSAMLDALCHGIESMWSVNSTPESKEYSETAIKEILENMEPYLNGDSSTNIKMLKAADTAGKAINITQTTAGHAMCYKLTGLCGLAHGHSAALCLAELLAYTARNTDKCIDARGEAYLKSTLHELSAAMGCADIEDAALKFSNILKSLELRTPVLKNNSDYELLVSSVNSERLKNNPIKLDRDVISMLYHNIVK